MKDIVPYKSKATAKLSISIKNQISPQIKRAYYIRKLSQWIVDQECELFSYSVWKSFCAVLTAEQLMHSYPGKLPESLEQMYHQTTLELLNNIHKINLKAAGKLLEELERVPDEIRYGSLLEDIRQAVVNLLNE